MCAVCGGASLEVVAYMLEQNKTESLAFRSATDGTHLVHVAVFNGQTHLLPYLVKEFGGTDALFEEQQQDKQQQNNEHNKKTTDVELKRMIESINYGM